MPSAVTVTFGRYTGCPLFGGGPSSTQLALAVKLQNTPTSVATYTFPGDPAVAGLPQVRSGEARGGEAHHRDVSGQALRIRKVHRDAGNRKVVWINRTGLIHPGRRTGRDIRAYPNVTTRRGGGNKRAVSIRSCVNHFSEPGIRVENSRCQRTYQIDLAPGA